MKNRVPEIIIPKWTSHYGFVARYQTKVWWISPALELLLDVLSTTETLPKDILLKMSLSRTCCLRPLKQPDMCSTSHTTPLSRSLYMKFILPFPLLVGLFSPSPAGLCLFLLPQAARVSLVPVQRSPCPVQPGASPVQRRRSIRLPWNTPWKQSKVIIVFVFVIVIVGPFCWVFFAERGDI